MSDKISIIYSEVYGILNMLGGAYIKKLPNELFEMIKIKKLSSYNPKYRKDIDLKEQNISKDAISFIALLHLNYWCNTANEKEKLEEIFKYNQKIKSEEMKKKYSINNMSLNGQEKKFENNNYINEVRIVEFKESIIKKFINKLKKLFGIN